MKAKDRQIIFNKYGGKCAYCGCDLVKGWHVDEIDPVVRKKKYVKGFFSDKVDDYGHKIYVAAKWIDDGCEFPENYRIENQNPACSSCNINKHSGSLEDFRKLIAGFMKHLNNVSTQYKIAKRYGLIQETVKPVIFYFETL